VVIAERLDPAGPDVAAEGAFAAPGAVRVIVSGFVTTVRREADWVAGWLPRLIESGWVVIAFAVFC
jgi:hypothetical protein